MGVLYTIFFINIQRLYWADSGLNQVASYDLDLDITSVIYKQQSANFYGISIFKVSHLFLLTIIMYEFNVNATHIFSSYLCIRQYKKMSSNSANCLILYCLISLNKTFFLNSLHLCYIYF